MFQQRTMSHALGSPGRERSAECNPEMYVAVQATVQRRALPGGLHFACFVMRSLTDFADRNPHEACGYLAGRRNARALVSERTHIQLRG